MLRNQKFYDLHESGAVRAAQTIYNHKAVSVFYHHLTFKYASSLMFSTVEHSCIFEFLRSVFRHQTSRTMIFLLLYIFLCDSVETYQFHYSQLIVGFTLQQTWSFVEILRFSYKSLQCTVL